MKIEIPFEPRAQKRPRASFKNKRPTVHEDKKMRIWRNAVTSWLRFNYKGQKFEGPIRNRVTFYLKAPKRISEEPKPKSRLPKRQEYQSYLEEKIPVDTTPDLDNLEKAVYDSVSKCGLIWGDDRQIVEHTTRKLYSPNPRIVLEIEKVANE